MHIVIDARMINASGIGVYLKNILNGLLPEFTITLLGDPELLVDYSSCKVVPFYEPIYSIKEQFALSKLIPVSDLFWSPHYNVPLFPIKSKVRIATIHDVYHLAFGKQLSLVQRLYARVVMSAATRFSKKVITVSQFSKAEILKYTSCKAGKVEVIYNGVSKTSTEVASADSIRSKYQLPPNYILFVGNVKPHKNLKTLLQAYLLLDDSVRHTHKIVVVGKKDGFITGDPALFDWISQTPDLKENVTFTGFVADEDIDAIYQLASLFVFPSLYEGFGLPPLEAMLNGCPVAVSNISCMPEVCGEAALYFDPLDARDVCDKIQAILTDSMLHSQLTTKGKSHLLNFSWPLAIRQHTELFKSMV